MEVYGLLYDDAGVIQQRMSGGQANIEATAAALGLSTLFVPDDAAYERTHRIERGELVALDG